MELDKNQQHAQQQILFNQLNYFSYQRKSQMQQPQQPQNQQFLILPSQRLLQYDSTTNKLSLLLTTRAEDFAYSNSKLALIFGKAVKYYDVSTGFTSTSAATLQSYFPKKVQDVTIDTEGKIVVTDKFGDIYQVRSENSLYLNSNLGIPTFMKHIHNANNNREYIILGDDYCKIKVYNYKNMHEVCAIWYIPNSVPLDVLQINKDTVVLLVKHQDKENLKHTYKLYEFRVDEMEKADFAGSLIYSDKTEKLSNSDYHPCSITYCSETRTLVFLKLYDEEIEVSSFKSNEKGLLTLEKTIKQKLPHPVQEGNSIEGFSVKQGSNSSLIISYGKYYNVDDQIQPSQQRVVQWKDFQKTELENTQVYKVSDREFLLKLRVD